MLRDVFQAVWAEPALSAPRGVPRIDLGLVVVLVPAAIAEGFLRSDVPWAPYVIACTIVVVLALLRRSHLPLAMTIVAFTAQTLAGVIPVLAGRDYGVLFVSACILLFPYSLGRWASGRDIVSGAGFLLVTHVITEPLYEESVANIVVGVGFLILPVTLGVAVRLWGVNRQRRRSEIQLRERERLARELHDTVAHYVSGIVIQAQAGRAVAPADPAAAVKVLTTIETAAAQTMTEMRSMVGVLREGEVVQRGPAKGLSDVDALVRDHQGSARAALETSGDLSGLGSAVEGVIYRLVQESLTNVRVHAPDATRVDVVVAGQPSKDRVDVSVTDDGGPTARSRRTGYGLIGMTERVEALGGSLHAGEHAGKGWKLHATIPTIRGRS